MAVETHTCAGWATPHLPGIPRCVEQDQNWGLRLREGDQPLPIPNDRPIVHDLVIEDVRARLELGKKRYGTGLQPFNGRKSLRDAYEEILDLAAYLRQKIWEEENPLPAEPWPVHILTEENPNV